MQEKIVERKEWYSDGTSKLLPIEKYSSTSTAMIPWANHIQKRQVTKVTTKTTIKEFNKDGQIVKETVKEETHTYTYPYYNYPVVQY